MVVGPQIHTHVAKSAKNSNGAYSAASDLELGGGGALLDLHRGGIRSAIKIKLNNDQRTEYDKATNACIFTAIKTL